jgi:hypothetical protein
MGNIASFFSQVWGYSKDSWAYVSGNQKKYVWLRTLHFLPNFGSNGGVKYWRYFSDAFNNASPSGYFGHNALAGKFVQDCGIGHSTKNGKTKTYISFSFIDVPGTKYVIQMDSTQMRLDETANSFETSATKERAIYDYKTAINKATYLLNETAKKIAALKAKKRTTAEERKLDVLLATYTSGIAKMKKLNGSQYGAHVNTTKINGLGEPITAATIGTGWIVVTIVGVVVVGILLWKLESIYMETKLANNIADNISLQNKLADQIESTLNNPNLSTAEKEKLVTQLTTHGIEPISKTQSELMERLKKEQDSGDLFGTMKNLLIWAVVGVVAVKGIDLATEHLHSKKQTQAA